MPTPVRAATPKPLKPKARKGSYKVTKPTSVALRLVRPWIVDRVIRWARPQGLTCETVNALTHIFGPAPKDGWRDSDGYDIKGYDVEGYDEDGYDKFNRKADGRDSAGFDRDGWSPSGVNRWGYIRNSDDVEQLLRRLPLSTRPVLRDMLKQLAEGERVIEPAAGLREPLRYY